MIHDVSATLAAILSFAKPSGDDEELTQFVETLRRQFPYLGGAVIQFDRPAEGEYEPASPRALNLFLYDVREDMEMRTNEPVVTRSDGEATIQRPPLRVACSYLVTAWPSGTASEDEKLTPPLREQRLLGEALQVLSQYPTIPAPLLQGSLAGQTTPLPMLVAQADGLKDPSEFWTAIKGKLRPSITVTLTVSVLRVVEERAKLVTATEFRIGERVSPSELKISPATLQVTSSSSATSVVAGRVTYARGAPAKAAVVTIPALSLRAVADADGRYRFVDVPAGRHTLRALPGSPRSKVKAKEVDVTVSAFAETVCDVRLSE